jgi:hypothetical protein
MDDDPFLILPDTYLRAIGLVCIQWTGLERLLSVLVMKLAGMSVLDPRATIVTAHMTFPLKLDIFKALIDELQTGYPHLSTVPSLYPRIGEAQARHNRIAHGAWTWDEAKERAALGRASARGRLKTSIEHITYQEIEKDAEFIKETGQLLYHHVIRSFPPSPP